MPSDDVRPLLVRMPAELHEAVKTTAAREDRTMAQVVREALRNYTAAPAPTSVSRAARRSA
jgi:predicted DNA-binding protein